MEHKTKRRRKSTPSPRSFSNENVSVLRCFRLISPRLRGESSSGWYQVADLLLLGRSDEAEDAAELVGVVVDVRLAGVRAALGLRRAARQRHFAH
eukprot:851005-Rhodomonas_salina.4